MQRPAVEKSKSDTGDEVDFAVALLDTPSTETTSPTVEADRQKEGPLPAAGEVSAPIDSLGVLQVPGKMVRVALRQNCSKVILNSPDTIEVRAASLRIPPWIVGQATIVAKGRGKIGIAAGNGAPHIVAMPCTLAVRDKAGLVAIDRVKYRGSIIISGNDRFSIVNYLDIEDYLRGVVPLEMGRRGNEAVEALKAQAVTARTYAYRRASANASGPFDMSATITDQMYGGVNAETPEADRAVGSTQGLVVVWRGQLAECYYHSTCGGMTADIAEVWGRAPCEYLSSVSDTGPDGAAWCKASKYFTWRETWNADQLSKILGTTVKEALPGERFTGSVQGITVKSRFKCGRVDLCELLPGSGRAVECKGDKVRYVLRRNGLGGGILRSANFTIDKNGPDTFVLAGKGYGHGVGLCQMGAIGRAQAGQSFRTILSAYFRNTEVRKVVAEGEEK